MFLIAAVMLGAASAFTTSPNSTLYVKDDGNWVVKSTVDHITGQCNAVQNMHCSFTLNPGSTQPYTDSDFTPADSNAQWQRY